MTKLKSLLLLISTITLIPIQVLLSKEITQDFSGIESLEVNPQSVTLDNPFAYSQVVTMAKLNNGQIIDATRNAKVEVQGDAVKISKSGLIEPIKDGNAILNFEVNGQKASVSVQVSGQAKKFNPDYVRDIMPVVSRMGCNQGTCHGSKDGRNGFKLSLRGYDPIYDIRAFTDDLGARRVNVAAPDSSLLLLKATGAVPHEGGQITKPDSNYYNIVKQWIAGGAKLDLSTPKVQGIEVFPKNPVVEKIGSKQQIRVVATFADGLKRDVTREAFVQSGNTEVAEPEKDSNCLLYTSPSPRDRTRSRMPSSA